MENYKPKAAQSKKDVVARLKQLIKKYNIVSVVNVENLTAKQLQTMRAKLRKDVEIVMTKKRLIKLAFKDNKDKPGIDALNNYLKGMPALLFTNKNPFSLFKTLKQNKSSAPIKAGQVAPNDIVVPKGPTGFAPGPIIGELGACKIKAGIEGGKVAIREDSLVAKEGEVISPKLAAVLLRLGIEPMEIGLDLTAAYENGNILDKSVLDIDEDAFINSIKSFASESFNLAMFIAYPVKETIMQLIQKVSTEVKNLAREAKVVNKETIKDILGDAHRQAMGLHSKVN